MNLPGYSPDFNADEAIWGWAREEATGNLCLGTKALVQQRVGNFLAGLASRRNEVRRRCRTVLQSRAEALLPNSQPNSPPQANAHPTLASGRLQSNVAYRFLLILSLSKDAHTSHRWFDRLIMSG